MLPNKPRGWQFSADRDLLYGLDPAALHYRSSSTAVLSTTFPIRSRRAIVIRTTLLVCGCCWRRYVSCCRALGGCLRVELHCCTCVANTTASAFASAPKPAPDAACRTPLRCLAIAASAHYLCALLCPDLRPSSTLAVCARACVALSAKSHPKHPWVAQTRDSHATGPHPRR